MSKIGRWLARLCKYIKISRKSWDKESCKEEFLKYDTKVTWEIDSISIRDKARRDGWAKEYFEEGELENDNE